MQSYQFSFYTSTVNSAKHLNNTITLDDFLSFIKSGKYAKQLNVLRSAKEAEQNALKMLLPYATISGIFTPGKRDAKSLQTHSGLLQIDIDPKEQKKFVLPDALKMLQSDSFILSVFKSPRNNGIKGIVKINAAHHKETFISLEKYFLNKYHLIIDKACKDVCRPFFVSYDSELFVNKESKIFEADASAPEPKKPAVKTDREKKLQDIEKLCTIVEERRVDLTHTYNTWLRIGFAIVGGLGEEGRNFFHRLSFFHAGYTPVKTDEQFDKCLKQQSSGVNWSSLFGVAKDFNISINGKAVNDISNSQSLQKPQTTAILQDQQLNKNLPTLIKVENFLNERFEFRRNVVNEKTEYRKKEPGAVWQDANENIISRFLEHNYFSFSPNKTASLLSSDFVNVFNPFTDYFNGLKYDPKKEPSYIDQLCKKIKAKEQERFNHHFKKMLVRSVACSITTDLTNNNFNKHVFVIINREQTIGKSSFCRWLCPPALKEYFIENISMDKDGLIALSTSFIINLDELASLSRYDINQLKAKISMASINERLPYGRRRQYYPRRANFLGSTNNDEFLNDDTGNARWLCFEIEGFEPGFWLPTNRNYIEIDKIWSEAKYLYDSGFRYQLNLDEKKENEIINRNYEERTIEEEMILSSFEIDSMKEQINFMTSTEVMQYLIINKSANANKISIKKIGSVLKKIGYVRGEKRGDKSYPIKGYFIKKLLN